MTGEGRKAWRHTDTPLLASLDIFGIRHFIYGGDPEWVRRRYWMVFSLGVGFVTSVAACVANAVGFLSDTLAKTVVDGFFTQLTVIGPGYIFGAAWEANKKIAMGGTTQETTSVVTEAGPPAKTTATTIKTVAPAEPADPKPDTPQVEETSSAEFRPFGEAP